MTAVLGNQRKIHEVLRRIGIKRGAGGPLTVHPNGGSTPSELLVTGTFGSGRSTTSIGVISTSEPKKPKLDASLCMASVPTASIAAVVAQQATAANIRAATVAAATAAAATVAFPGPTPTSSASTSSAAIPSETQNQNHAASTSAVSQNGSSALPDPPFSRVVHLRNIPSDMTELELVHFCLPFGKLINYLMLKGKNQAFVEYQDETGAATIVNVAQACPMAIRGRTIFCQYSTHQELKTERKGACKNGSIFALAAVTIQQAPSSPSSAGTTPSTVLPVAHPTSAITTTIGVKRTVASSSPPPVAVAAAAAAAAFFSGGAFDANAAKRQRLVTTAGQLQVAQAQIAAFQQAAVFQQQHQALLGSVGASGPSAVALQQAYLAGKAAQMAISGVVASTNPPESNLLVLSNATNNQTPSNSLSPVATKTPATSASTNSNSQLDISTQQAPNAVLRVIIDSMIYPVTLEVLHTIFSRYGKVLRIITFNKNNTFQALVQLSEANAAQQARSQLDGQNVYNNCCTLRVDYSKLSTLNIKYNNDKSRDYTNPTLPSGEMTLEQQLSLISAATGQGQPATSLGALAPGVFPFMAGAGGQLAFAQQALANEGLGVNPALAPFLGQLSGALQSGVVNPSGPAPSVAGMPFNAINLLAITPVVLVSNLNEHKVTPDALFTLFGVYGDVQRVKILFNKKDNALIQYAEPQQAQYAIQHLDKVRWFNRMIRVTSSKHSNVQMPKEGQPDAGLTRDYTNSTLRRFKKPGSKNYMNIYPPSSTLHLSNIPPNVSEEFLRTAFEEKKFNVTEFKFFQRDHKMALIQLADVEQAINALVEMHNFKLAENAHLRVSFSKKGINV